MSCTRRKTASGIVGHSTNWLPCRFRSMDATDAASRNRLLAALEPDDLRRLAPHLERVDLARDLVQVPGRALRLPLATLREAIMASPRLHQVCLCYVAALIAHVLQSVACHALHTVEARLARWLLLFQDRVDGAAALPITQELLAEVLGVQRTTVTAAARLLQQAGLIAYKWGSVTVLDRAGLERVSCECYGVIREHYKQVSSCIRA